MAASPLLTVSDEWACLQAPALVCGARGQSLASAKLRLEVELARVRLLSQADECLAAH